MSGRLPYFVKTWFHGHKMRRKSLMPRGAVVELLTRELCLKAKRQYVRRSRTRMADLERELEAATRKGKLEPDSSGPTPDEYLARPLLPKLDGTRFAGSSLALDSSTKERSFAELGARRRPSKELAKRSQLPAAMLT
jgi:hypothetical protein